MKITQEKTYHILFNREATSYRLGIDEESGSLMDVTSILELDKELVIMGKLRDSPESDEWTEDGVIVKYVNMPYSVSNYRFED